MKKFLQNCFGALFLMCLTQLAFAASNDPVNMLQSISDKMIAQLQAHQATLKTNPRQVYSFANNLIVPHADVAEMSKRVLPPRIWDQASAAQRSQFQKQFTTLLVHTYASALASYKDETVKFFPVRGGYDGKTTTKVDSSIIRSEGPSIPVSYKLVNHGSEWKLYDMVVDGVSLLESFRSQFADKLSNGNMDSLIRDLAVHNQG